MLLGRMTSQLRGLRGRQRTLLGAFTKQTEADRPASSSNVDHPPPPLPPPLMDVHARLRGSVLSAPSSSRPSPGRGVRGKGCESNGIDRAMATVVSGTPVDAGLTAAAVFGCRPMGLEPTGVERLGSHYSPAAQFLYIDPNRGCLAWRDGDGRDCPYSGGGGSEVCNIFFRTADDVVESSTGQRRAERPPPLSSPSCRRSQKEHNSNSCSLKAAERKAPAPTGTAEGAYPSPFSPPGTSSNRGIHRPAVAFNARPRPDNESPGAGAQQDRHVSPRPVEQGGGAREGDGEESGMEGNKAGAVVMQAACAAGGSEVNARLEAGFER